VAILSNHARAGQYTCRVGNIGFRFHAVGVARGTPRFTHTTGEAEKLTGRCKCWSVFDERGSYQNSDIGGTSNSLFYCWHPPDLTKRNPTKTACCLGRPEGCQQYLLPWCVYQTSAQRHHFEYLTHVLTTSNDAGYRRQDGIDYSLSEYITYIVVLSPTTPHLAFAPLHRLVRLLGHHR
jgi:hypothetical protein